MAKSKSGAAKKAAGILKQWSKTEAVTGGMLPDANYECNISEAEALVKNDKLKAHWIMKVTDGKYEGKKVHKWDNLSTAKNLEYLKGALETLEIDIPEDLDTVKELDAVLKETVGLDVEIRVVTKSSDKGDFTNVYFQQLLGDGASEESDDDEADEDVDDDDDDDDEEEEDDDE